MTAANEPGDVHVPVLRQLGAADAEAFSALRREVTADNPVPMGLTLQEELTRPLQGFRDQLSYPEPCGVEPEAINIGGRYYDGQFMSLLLDAA